LLVPQFVFADDIAYWSFDDGSCSIAWESSGNGYNRYIENPQWIYPGKSSNSSGFDASTNFDSGYIYNFVSDDELTFLFWIKTDSNSEAIVSSLSGRNTDPDCFEIVLPSSVAIQFFVRDSNGDETYVVSTDSINDNSWHHVAAVRESDATLKLYIDTAFNSSASGPTGTIQTSNNLIIGADYDHDNWAISSIS
jgi:hypothetical protein